MSSRDRQARSWDEDEDRGDRSDARRGGWSTSNRDDSGGADSGPFGGRATRTGERDADGGRAMRSSRSERGWGPGADDQAERSFQGGSGRYRSDTDEDQRGPRSFERSRDDDRFEEQDTESGWTRRSRGRDPEDDDGGHRSTRRRSERDWAAEDAERRFGSTYGDPVQGDAWRQRAGTSRGSQRGDASWDEDRDLPGSRRGARDEDDDRTERSFGSRQGRGGRDERDEWRSDRDADRRAASGRNRDWNEEGAHDDERSERSGRAREERTRHEDEDDTPGRYAPRRNRSQDEDQDSSFEAQRDRSWARQDDDRDLGSTPRGSRSYDDDEGAERSDSNRSRPSTRPSQGNRRASQTGRWLD